MPTLDIIVNSPMGPSQIIQVEADSAGNVSGEKLIAALCTSNWAITLMEKGYEPGQLSFITKTGGRHLVPSGTYNVKETQEFEIRPHVAAQMVDELEKEPVDTQIVDLVRTADLYSVAGYLLSAPNDPTQLARQQWMDEILTALKSGRKLSVVLIDKNFEIQSHLGQVVKYIIDQFGAAAEAGVNGPIYRYRFTRFGGQPVTQEVVVTYVGKNANRVTRDALRELKVRGRFFIMTKDEPQDEEWNPTR